VTWEHVASSSDDPLDTKVTFGKFEGYTWREVFEDDDGPSYVRWAVQNVGHSIGIELREALTDELEDGGFGLG
jgi:hypothetical protein